MGTVKVKVNTIFFHFLWAAIFISYTIWLKTSIVIIIILKKRNLNEFEGENDSSCFVNGYVSEKYENMSWIYPLARMTLFVENARLNNLTGLLKPNPYTEASFRYKNAPLVQSIIIRSNPRTERYLTTYSTTMWSCDWEAIRNHQMQPLQLFKLDKIVPTLEILTVVKNVEQNWKHIWQLGDRGRKAAKEDRDLKKFISSEMAHRDEVFMCYSSKSNIQYSYHPTLNFPYVSTSQPILDYLKCYLAGQAQKIIFHPFWSIHDKSRNVWIIT